MRFASQCGTSAVSGSAVTLQEVPSHRLSCGWPGPTGLFLAKLFDVRGRCSIVGNAAPSQRHWDNRFLSKNEQRGKYITELARASNSVRNNYSMCCWVVARSIRSIARDVRSRSYIARGGEACLLPQLYSRPPFMR